MPFFCSQLHPLGVKLDAFRTLTVHLGAHLRHRVGFKKCFALTLVHRLDFHAKNSTDRSSILFWRFWHRFFPTCTFQGINLASFRTPKVQWPHLAFHHHMRTENIIFKGPQEHKRRAAAPASPPALKAGPRWLIIGWSMFEQAHVCPERVVFVNLRRRVPLNLFF